MLPNALRMFIYNQKLFLAGAYLSLFKKKAVLDGATFHIPFDKTDIQFRGRFALDTYEKDERRFLKSHLDRDATVLELGACLGVVACITNKLLDNKNKHVVVEANPEMIEWIERNRAENNGGFQVEHCMVTNQKENEFYIHDLIVGGSAMRKTPKKVTVPGKTIEELEKDHRLKFDTLIMDIEGGEVQFIEENKEKLKQFRKIFMEVHTFDNILTEEQVQEAENTLKEIGFELLIRSGCFQLWGKK